MPHLNRLPGGSGALLRDRYQSGQLLCTLSPTGRPQVKTDPRWLASCISLIGQSFTGPCFFATRPALAGTGRTRLRLGLAMFGHTTKAPIDRDITTGL